MSARRIATRGKLPRWSAGRERPISHDQVKLMQKDNVVSPGALTFADLGITPAALEAVAPSCLGGERG